MHARYFEELRHAGNDADDIGKPTRDKRGDQFPRAWTEPLCCTRAVRITSEETFNCIYRLAGDPRLYRGAKLIENGRSKGAVAARPTAAVADLFTSLSK